jgi:hypothetical protein
VAQTSSAQPNLQLIQPLYSFLHAFAFRILQRCLARNLDWIVAAGN